MKIKKISLIIPLILATTLFLSSCGKESESANIEIPLFEKKQEQQTEEINYGEFEDEDSSSNTPWNNISISDDGKIVKSDNNSNLDNNQPLPTITIEDLINANTTEKLMSKYSSIMTSDTCFFETLTKTNDTYNYQLTKQYLIEETSETINVEYDIYNGNEYLRQNNINYQYVLLEDINKDSLYETMFTRHILSQKVIDISEKDSFYIIKADSSSDLYSFIEYIINKDNYEIQEIKYYTTQDEQWVNATVYFYYDAEPVSPWFLRKEYSTVSLSIYDKAEELIINIPFIKGFSPIFISEAQPKIYKDKEFKNEINSQNLFSITEDIDLYCDI